MDSTQKESYTKPTQPLRSRRLNLKVKLETCTGSKVTEAQQASPKNRGKNRKLAGEKKGIKSNELTVKKDETKVIEILSDMDQDSEEKESEINKALEMIKKTVYKKACVSAGNEIKMKLTKYQSLADSKDAVGAKIKGAQEEN